MTSIPSEIPEFYVRWNNTTASARVDSTNVVTDDIHK